MLNLLGKAIRKILKWILFIFMTALTIECVSFLLIISINYAIYGTVREGSRVTYDPYVIFENKDGLRPTASNPSPGSGIPVWMFGGSTMRGATDDPAMTIPSRLAKRLNHDTANYEVINFGENSYNTLMETKRFQKACIMQDRDPGLVIFYDGANDSTYFSQYRTRNAHHGYRRMSGMVESYHKGFFGIFKGINAAVRVSFTRELYDKVTFALVPIKADDPELAAFIDDVERRYDYLAREAAYRNAGFIVFWQPIRWIEESDKNDSQFAAYGRNIRVIYSSLANRLQPKPWFVRLDHVLEGQTDVYAADGVHLKDKGRDIVAKAMFDELIKHNQIDRE